MAKNGIGAAETLEASAMEYCAGTNPVNARESPKQLALHQLPLVRGAQPQVEVIQNVQN